ncbi:MAG: hypothetical protein ABW185_00875 [Sedimenticola sp.]
MFKKKEENLIKCVWPAARAAAIQSSAKRKQDAVYGKILGVDIIAREAHYHRSCYRDYNRMDTRNEMRTHEESNESKSEQAAHMAAVEHICAYIESSIIEGANVERMTMIKEKYLAFMLENHPQFYNQSYKTYKLKDKLIKVFGCRIKFWQPNYKSELVYSAELPGGQAVEFAFELAASDSKRLEEAALILRRNILELHKDSGDLPWPPSTEFLLNEIEPPPLVREFVCHVLTKKALADASNTKLRLVGSIAQDICYTTTRGQWKMPKHLLLGMSVRHLTGSAELITLLNRFGHCVSYSTLLELETAMCNSIAIRQSVIPPTIQRRGNIVTHLCWDNFDLLEETPTGAGTTHTAHGIIIQEVTETIPTEQCTQVPKTKLRSSAHTTEVMEPCYAKDKSEPNIQVHTVHVSDSNVETQAHLSDMVWIIVQGTYGAFVTNSTRVGRLGFLNRAQ